MRITSGFDLKTLKATASAPLTPQQIVPIELTSAAIDKALGHHAPISGINVSTPSGWFATRPSGTENIYNIDAESFRNVAPCSVCSHRQGSVDAAPKPKEPS